MSCQIADTIRDHLGVSDAVAAFLAKSLREQAFDDDPYLFDRNKDIENLDRLSRALGGVIAALRPDAMSEWAREDLKNATVYKALDQYLNADAGRWDESSGKGALAQLRDLDALTEFAEAVRGGIRETKSAIEKSDNTRNSLARHNLDGMRLVHTARRLWEKHKDEAAPSGSDIKISGPFGTFLQDLFDACGTQGDPRYAYRAWHRERETFPGT